MRSFYFKLIAIFSGIMILFGALVAYTSIRASSRIIQESIQKTNKDLASRLVPEFQPIVDDNFDEEAIAQKLRELSGENPQFDFYLLSRQGMIKSFIQGQNNGREPETPMVDVKPLNQFIAGEPLPILGMDPRNPNLLKPFSAANITIMGEEDCFIYVVLEGNQFTETADMIEDSYILRGSLIFIGTILLIGLAIGFFIFRMLTRRLDVIKRTVKDFERGELNKRIPIKSNDEITDLSLCFNRMADTVVESMNDMKKADKLRRDLVANVSHDLRNPLSSIQGYVETIQMKGDEITREELQRYLEPVLSNTKKLNRMIDDLFDLSKLDAENVTPNLEDISLAELVQDLVQQFTPIADQKNIQIKTIYPENPHAQIYADIGLLDRALSNLIDNAIQHTPEGGTVTIKSIQNGKDISLEISDSGRGIPESDIPHIFDRFYQVDKSRSNSSGAGLGLSIAQKILELHGAKITVQSLLNKGTTFKIMMPR
ncbi:sensor histidine kinase [Rhodohalobacter sulfatireducens]|uniref:histidine kinase n=1 Tax=Rhodohalobacter sulfatireducens TaxID=2911366 RepID=A0ABS9KHW2_9BACT|nr:HAMP domain-containing sensor histidine kinase [Rhodohalobacter sulfatireducens]MCG2590415.1 HAMP domain-containing histidine kinase [Rhodohalobacter sulfatireducens]MDR9366084.1 HAMP domain-containing sensor histidine kinase [Balneolaceae bacterium]MDR9408479.1 HAMP domain-containing sensor histidine kinase [Balneolaceae bacterium]